MEEQSPVTTTTTYVAPVIQPIEDEDGRSVLQWNDGNVKPELLWANYREHGYVRVRGVLSEEQCKERVKLFWDWAKVAAPKWDKKDPKTWTDLIRPPHDRGRINCQGMSNQKYAEDTRLAVRKVFEMMLDSTEVVSSHEGPIVAQFPKRCCAQNLTHWAQKDGGWEKDMLTVEQTDPSVDMSQICSVVALVDENLEGQCMSVVPKSHMHYQEIMDEESYKMNKPRRGCTYRISPEQIKFIRKKLELKLLRIPLKAGDMIIYSPRLIYGTAGFCKSADLKKARQFQVRVAMDLMESYRFQHQISIRTDAWDSGYASTSCVKVFRKLTLAPTFGKTGEYVNAPPYKSSEKGLKISGRMAYDLERLTREDQEMEELNNPVTAPSKKRTSEQAASSAVSSPAGSVQEEDSDDSSPKKKKKSKKEESSDEEEEDKKAKKAEKKERKRAKKEKKRAKKEEKKKKKKEEQKEKEDEELLKPVFSLTPKVVTAPSSPQKKTTTMKKKRRNSHQKKKTSMIMAWVIQMELQFKPIRNFCGIRKFSGYYPLSFFVVLFATRTD